LRGWAILLVILRDLARLSFIYGQCTRGKWKMPKNLPKPVSRESRAANPRTFCGHILRVILLVRPVRSIRGTLHFLDFFILATIMGSDPKNIRKTPEARFHTKFSTHIVRFQQR
jgi:hypothetical protein